MDVPPGWSLASEIFCLSHPGGRVATTRSMSDPVPVSAAPPSPREASRLSELSPQQWKSGVAAWLGWLFDGLELHLYTLVATPLVIQLVHATSNADPAVKEKSAYIQAAFLVGWAAGGGGVVGLLSLVLPRATSAGCF